MHSASRRLACLAVLTVLAPAARADEPVSFRNEVMAVLSRGDCNAGACHGNQNGKNGFKLSLRGEDPDFDLAVLTRDQLARRTDRFHPEESLILLKATAAIPHEGAKRFAVGSREYDILRRLLAAGKSNEEIVEELYFAALCRPPSEKERAGALSLIARDRDRRRALEDVLWGLVNAKEFLLRQ